MSEIFKPSIQDAVRAQSKAVDVLIQVATPEQVATATHAMLDASGRHEGHRAFYLSLLATADADAQSEAADAFAAALAESAERHAQRHAEPVYPDFDGSDADDSDDDDEDSALV